MESTEKASTTTKPRVCICGQQIKRDGPPTQACRAYGQLISTSHGIYSSFAGDGLVELVPREPFGDEDDEADRQRLPEHCPECGIPRFCLHHVGCPADLCPNCKQPDAKCECDYTPSYHECWAVEQ